jgi:hypothetical protein
MESAFGMICCPKPPSIPPCQGGSGRTSLGARASRPLRGFFLRAGRPRSICSLLPPGEGSGMRALRLRERERSIFRPSPDKGVERGIRGALRRARGTGCLCKGDTAGQGVCGGGIRLWRNLSPQTPLIPPLSGGKWGSYRYRSHHSVLCDDPEEREPQGRTGLALFLQGLKVGFAHLQTQISLSKNRVLLFAEH